MEQIDKVEKLNENPIEIEEQVKVDDGGGEINGNEISDMEKLPPEILMKILRFLDFRQLLKCRLLNSRWNEISCLLLQDKSNINPKSKFATPLEDNKNFGKVGREYLDRFLNCFAPTEVEKSSGRRRPFPFSCFKVRSLQFMDVTRICEFVQAFGPHMKTVFAIINQEDIANFQSFWKLLLHFAPNIQHLKIIEDSCLKNVRLFDPVAEFIAKFDPNFKVLTPQDTFLKNLKVLKIASSNFGEFNDFMKHLLDNAPNLQQVSSIDPFHQNDWKHVQVWQELNKAHLIKGLVIHSASKVTFSPADVMKNLRLLNLESDCKVSSDSVENETSTTNHIYHALKSSQKTLTCLFLYNLSMNFMALSFKDIASLPNVHQLVITVENPEETENVFEKLRQLCPNATSLNLQFGRGDFSQVVPMLWTRFQGLQSLTLGMILIDGNDDSSFDLDSAFSGYSKMSLWRIKARLKRGISLEGARGNEPQNPSILDLKGLSRLQLNFRMGTRTEEMEELKNQLQNSIFIKILPQHIRENPRSICYF